MQKSSVNRVQKSPALRVREKMLPKASWERPGMSRSVPGSSREPPGSLPGRPETSQESPRGVPAASQSVPRASPERPERLPDASGITPRRPKAVRAPFWFDFGYVWALFCIPSDSYSFAGISIFFCKTHSALKQSRAMRHAYSLSAFQRL